MRILILIAAVALAACQNADARPGNETAGQAASPVASSPGKPLHPIQVRAVVAGKVQAGVETGAEIVVTSGRPAERIEVVLQPASGMVVSENRFERTNGKLSRGAALKLPFRFIPAASEAQNLTVLVRVTDTAGRVLTREVTLSLDDASEEKGERTKQLREVTPQQAPEPEGDALVPAEQEIIRN